MNDAPTPIDPSRRRPLLAALAAVVALGAAAGGAWWWTSARLLESTDDAYVAGDVVTVTPRIPGTVLSVRAEDTDGVRAGDPLVELDPADARVALDAAEAELARAVRGVRQLFATRDALAASVRNRETDLAKAQEDYTRRQKLGGNGAVSAEEIEHARSAMRAAEALLANVRQQLAANAVMVEGTTVDTHPDVKRAAAQVEAAALALARTTITAPVDGQVAKRTVQVGTRIEPGTPLLAVVPLDRLWVDANFKESQLGRLRIGQPVQLSADTWGRHVEYHGKVVGLGAGTGGAFALLPAQNASGNWIKVVQRVPVRIELDRGELAAHPLRIGLSMQVEVDVRDQSGPQLATAGARGEPLAQTVGDTAALADIRERIRTIIADNDGELAGSTGAPVVAGPADPRGKRG
ncbi:membrane fusion protein (multidrug efflux system) [Plasticicumulans lactativorans]|uniref:Membrane fusion protein (Multidrug efflux system) n=1 Tax=Plasticicumulans lactativorans TaxID=1133106 RepID=A0A4V2SCG8_9GAMM|nr:HlyD family efflux transporter periplasmic adaptor subunit [Plasticicumulans lactativorans]TCO79230.1 membrane fusion protein (multidrug efflux system) [Plasticicumulans lactativorans]